MLSDMPEYDGMEYEELVTSAQYLWTENAKLRKLLSHALVVAGYHGRQYLDSYLREHEGTNLLKELKSVGIEVSE